MNKSLFSLAVVKTNWEKKGKDHIENYIPMVGTLLLEEKIEEVSGENLSDLAKKFKKRFGLHLPAGALTVIIRRMSKEGYVSKKENSWTPKLDKLLELDISSKSNEIERKFNSLIGGITNYVKEMSDETIEPTVIERGLLSLLKKHDLDILFAAQNGSILPKVAENKKIEFLICKYIEDVEKNDPVNFQIIVDVSIGHALASTILYDEFQVFSGKLKELNIFFDSTWLFDLLGIRGQGIQNVALELLNMLTSEKANKKVFDINVNELLTNFEICLEDYQKNKNIEKASRTYKHCKSNDISETDVQTFVAKLADILKEKYEIISEEIPNYNGDEEYVINENELYDIITKTYSEHNIISIIEDVSEKEKEYMKEKGGQNKPSDQAKKNTKKEEERDNNTIWRDVQSISGIYRIRKGIAPRTLKDSKAIFVTTNSSLAQAARKFEMGENYPKSSIPSCITDYFLSTLIWLASPSLAEGIIKRKLIADCYAFTQPDSKLIKHYLSKLDKLKEQKKIDDDTHLLLRTFQGAYNILNAKTYGDIKEFTPNTPYEILEQILEDLKAEQAEILQDEINQKDLEIEKVSFNYEKLKNSHEKMKEQHLEVKQILTKTHENIEKRVEKISKFISYTLLFTISILLFWSTYKIDKNVNFKYIAIVEIILMLLGIANIVFGFTVIKYVDKLTNFLRKYLMVLLVGRNS